MLKHLLFVKVNLVGKNDSYGILIAMVIIVKQIPILEDCWQWISPIIESPHTRCEPQSWWDQEILNPQLKLWEM